MHLKVIQTMSKVPRSVGIPPLSDSGFDQALALQASSVSTSTVGGLSLGPLADDDGKINPLAGMGLTDEQYTIILQNLVNGESFMGIGPLDPSVDVGVAGGSGVKRTLDDAVDGRDGKRSRFEVVE